MRASGLLISAQGEAAGDQFVVAGVEGLDVLVPLGALEPLQLSASELALLELSLIVLAVF